MDDRSVTANPGNDPVAGALRYLSEEFSLSRQEWRDHHRGGDAMLDALVSHGYAIQQGDRFAVSDLGRRRLADSEPDQVGA